MKMTDIENSNELKVKKTRGKLLRISGDEAAFGREYLRQIAFLIEPDDQTQRRIFSSYLPQIYFLKESMGYTFKFITKCLKDTGMNLSDSSLRVYYSQMIPGRKEECVTKMKEFSQFLDELKKETEGVEVSKIAEKVTEITNRNRLNNDS